ncbi:CAPA peptides-like [Aricia agestis]|uniref:CAPA peptides-like n=1 Tax=Aricia agestis TaxID=91739 RepID=UPI001C20BC82|nr:CAPA peptides-like [Aricia agestis]
MQFVAKISLSLFLLTSAVTSSYLNSVKFRRDGIAYVNPYPRIGRSSGQTWLVPIKGEFTGEELSKRLMHAFPRIGRRSMPRQADLVDMLQETKRESSEEGMWFGPRLGRSFRGDDDDTAQNDVERNDLGAMEEPERRKRQIPHTEITN